MNSIKDNLTLVIAIITLLGFLASGAKNTFDLIDKVNNLDVALAEQTSWVQSHVLSFAGQLDKYQTENNEKFDDLYLIIEQQQEQLDQLQQLAEGTNYWVYQIEQRICNANTITNKIGGDCDD